MQTPDKCSANTVVAEVVVLPETSCEKLQSARKPCPDKVIRYGMRSQIIDCKTDNGNCIKRNKHAACTSRISIHQSKFACVSVCVCVYIYQHVSDYQNMIPKGSTQTKVYKIHLGRLGNHWSQNCVRGTKRSFRQQWFKHATSAKANQKKLGPT